MCGMVHRSEAVNMAQGLGRPGCLDSGADAVFTDEGFLMVVPEEGCSRSDTDMSLYTLDHGANYQSSSRIEAIGFDLTSPSLPRLINDGNGSYILGTTTKPNNDEVFLMKGSLTNTSEVDWSIYLDSPGSLSEMVVGSDFSTTFVGTTETSDVQVTQIDPYGEVAWTVFVDTTDANEGISISKLPNDNGFAVLSTNRGLLTLGGGAIYRRHLLFFTLNNAREVNVLFAFGSSDTDRPYSLRTDSNGDHIYLAFTTGTGIVDATQGYIVGNTLAWTWQLSETFSLANPRLGLDAEDNIYIFLNLDVNSGSVGLIKLSSSGTFIEGMIYSGDGADEGLRLSLGNNNGIIVGNTSSTDSSGDALVITFSLDDLQSCGFSPYSLTLTSITPFIDNGIAFTVIDANVSSLDVELSITSVERQSTFICTPTEDPTMEPAIDPTVETTINPTADPTMDPTEDPTEDPTMSPTNGPVIAYVMDMIVPTLEESEGKKNTFLPLGSDNKDWNIVTFSAIVFVGTVTLIGVGYLLWTKVLHAAIITTRQSATGTVQMAGKKTLYV